MAPQLDAYAQRSAGSVLVAKLDTDANPNTSMRFGIRSIPTLAVFVAGQEAGREVGAVPDPAAGGAGGARTRSAAR
jgi:thioredoxin-like negative regulator of GroEL